MAKKIETKPAKNDEQKPAAGKEKFTASTNGTSIRSRTSSWFECKVRYQRPWRMGQKRW